MKLADLFIKLGLKNDGFNKGIDQSKKKVSGFASGLKTVGKQIAGFFAFGAILAGVRSAINTNIKFEKSLSTLKSLTGATADEMKFYAAESKRMGETTTQSASQVAAAFTLIGSKKPELLKNKEALAQVTEQAIILAEAANIDVAQAAGALANSLNQMGKGADQSNRFINALAAGSKVGAADINFLNAAIQKAGGSADAVGLQFEELVAGIETIAPKISEPTTAGLQFRQVLVKLASGVDKFNPTVVGLSKALHNLQAEQLTINELTQKFGILNINAAKALIDGADAYDDYRKGVTGTNTALEQQKINVDNVQGSITQLSSAWEGFVLNMQKGNGAANAFLKSLTGILFVLNGTDFKKAAFEGLSDAIALEVNRGGNELELFKIASKNMANEVSKQVEMIRANFGEGILSKANDQEFIEFASGPVKKALLTLNKLRADSVEVNKKVQKLETDELKKDLAERFDLQKKDVEQLEKLRRSFASFTGERKKEADLILPLIEAEIDKRLKASQDEITSYKSIAKSIEDLQAEKESLSKTDLESIAIINDKIKALEKEKKALDGLRFARGEKNIFSKALKAPSELQAAKAPLVSLPNQKDIDRLEKQISDLKINLILAIDKKSKQAITSQINKLESELSKEQGVEIPLKLTIKGTFADSEGFKALKKNTEKEQEEFLANQQSFNQQAAQLAADFVTDTVVVFAEGIGAMFSGDFNVGEFGKALLAAVGGFLSNLGKMMIQFGATALVYSILAKALSNPVTAGPAAIGMIAAGAALVAIGSAIGSASSGGGGGSAGGGAITTIDTRGGRTQNTSGSLQNTVAQPQTLIIEGEIRNSVIALSNKKGKKDLAK